MLPWGCRAPDREPAPCRSGSPYERSKETQAFTEHGSKHLRVKLLGATVIVLALAIPAAAQPEEGDAVAGRELASQLCAGCHIIGAERVGSDAAPPFPSIAQDPDITVTELHGWIGPMHPMLSNLALTPEQTADINAYLDSLRGPQSEDAPERLETEQPPPEIEQSPPERIGPPIGPQPE
jgi:mono/diheme cytochrome c family protein